jgi:phosphoadenosine phosphosulfate reductase
MILNEYSKTPERTARNGINSLLNLFDTTPLGNELKIGAIEKEGNVRYVRKIGTDEIHPIAVAYSLYKYAEEKRRFNLTVSEFYSDDQCEGPYRLFGISKEKLESILRWLQENKNEMVRIDLVGGLDNINLREDLTCEKILLEVS